MKNWLLLAFIAVLIAESLPCVHAQQNDALRKQFQEQKAAAEQGNAVAQCNLGICYANGMGVEKDEEKAVDWFFKAAEQGNANAQYNLGVCYHNGQGVEKDYARAVKSYRKAAEQGNADAQSNLGICYADGTGVDKDDAEAMKWFFKAAEQGEAVAQYNLGVRYRNGEGVDANDVEAYAWFNLASKKHKNAGEIRDKLEKEMSPQQVADAQKRTKELLVKQLLAQKADLMEKIRKLKEHE